MFLLSRAPQFVLVSFLVTSCGWLPPLGSKRLQKDVANVHGIAPDKWSALPRLNEAAATGWLADFESPTLRQLVDRAISANPDLKAAAARVTQTQAQTVRAGADLSDDLWELQCRT